ncbi:hypothetical protein DIPPA_21505 [Diplonema papillatum]|nr:hypothetical protein DIPPA_21505 [Diplonema papillatum]
MNPRQAVRLFGCARLAAPARLQRRHITEDEIARALAESRAREVEKTKRPPSAPDRGRGLRAAVELDVDRAAAEARDGAPQLAAAVELIKLGDWPAATSALEALRKSVPAMQNDAKVLMLLARCLIERSEYEAAKKYLGLCDALHAGVPGLADMKEEAAWGIQLWGEFVAERTAKERKMQEHRKATGYFAPEDFKLAGDDGFDTLNNHPLEPESVTWLKAHVGEALQHIGLVQDDVRGRILAAKRPIPKGTVIFAEKSLLFAPEYLSRNYADKRLDEKKGLLEAKFATAAKPTYCSHCQGAFNEDRHVCTGCGLNFCSAGCQADATKTYHSYECEALKGDPLKVIRDRLEKAGKEALWQRFLTMVRVTAVSLSQGKKWPNEQPWFAHLAYREGEHRKATALKASETDELLHDVKPTMYGMMAVIYSHLFIAHKLGAGWKQLPADSLKARLKEAEIEYDLLFDKVKENAQSPYNTILPFLTMLNHSCMPNAHLTSTHELVADEDIPQYHEITISYTPKNIPVELQYQWLLKNRHFRCRCMYCTFREMNEAVDAHEMQEDVGASFVEENIKTRQEREDPERLYTSTGILTKRGLAEVNSRHDRILAKYPKEFREQILEIQEQATRDLQTKPRHVVENDLKRRKDRLARMEKAGLLEMRPAEKIALTAGLESVEQLRDDEGTPPPA